MTGQHIGGIVVWMPGAMMGSVSFSIVRNRPPTRKESLAPSFFGASPSQHKGATLALTLAGLPVVASVMLTNGRRKGPTRAMASFAAPEPTWVRAPAPASAPHAVTSQGTRPAL